MAQTTASPSVDQQMSLWNKISAAFTEAPKPVNPVFRNVMLFVIVLLLAGYFQWRLTLSPEYRGDRNGNGIVALMLLTNLLAWQFHWPIAMRVALRLVSVICLAFGSFYIFYWSRVLYR
jgi:hypothetical protein